MTDQERPINPLSAYLSKNPIEKAREGLDSLRENWAKHSIEPFPVPLALPDPALPRGEWFPEPQWMSGYDAFQLFQLQSEPHNQNKALARICAVISDQIDRDTRGLNFVLGRLPPRHILLEPFVLGSNQWFRALHVLLTLRDAEGIEGFEMFVSDMQDWINPYDSLRLRSYDVIENALTLDWYWRDLSLPEAKQDPIWSFPKAMAWIGTRDYLALARMGTFYQPDDEMEPVVDNGVNKHNTAALGWLHTMMSYSHCKCGALKEHGIRSFQHCTCISVAWEELVHFNGGLTNETPELVFGMQEGWLSMTWPDGADKLRFLRRDILDRWPLLVSDVEREMATGPSTVGAEKECRDWLYSAFAADPEMIRTKKSFQTEALTHFGNRLSVRGFLRVWDSIANTVGRSTPGRKS